MIVLALTR